MASRPPASPLNDAFARLGIGDRRVTTNFARSFRKRRAERGRPAREGAYVFERPANRVTGNTFPTDPQNGGITLDELITGHKPRVDDSTARWEGVKSGALFGGADEVEGWGGAAGNWLGRNGGDWLAPGVSFLTGRGWDSNATFNKGTGDFSTDMEEHRRTATQFRDQAWDTNRNAFLQGYVPGVVVSAGAPALRAAGVANPLARYGAMAGTGAIYGGIQGGLSAEPGDRLEGAGRGAALGAVLAPVAGRLIDNLAEDIPAAYRALTGGDETARLADVGDNVGVHADDAAEIAADPMQGRNRPLVVEADAPAPQAPAAPVRAAFDPEAAAIQRERLGAIGDEPMDPALSTAAGAEDTLTFPNGRQAEVKTWDNDGIAARIAEERPDLVPGKAADNAAAVADDVAPAAPDAPKTPVQRLQDALGGIDDALAKQGAARTAERGRRIGAAREAGAEGGQAGFFAEKGKMKGPLPKLTADDIRSNFKQEDLDGLFDTIRTHFGDDFFKTLNARNGLQRMLEGELPRQSELNLLLDVFGAPTVKKLIQHREAVKAAFGGHLNRDGQAEMFTGEEVLSTGPMKTLADEPRPVDPNKFVDNPKQGDFFVEKPGAKPKGTKPGDPAVAPVKERSVLANALNLPRALRATFDLSAPFRQGVFLVGRKQFWKSLPSMVKQFASKDAYEAVAAEISSRPTSEFMKRARLALTDTSGPLAQREEEFMSDWAKRIPLAGIGVRASERAYSGFLNKLRADVFDDLLAKAEKIGVDVDDDKWLKALGGYINNATGRGDLGKLNQAAPVLSGLFFSPRLMASRVNLLRPDYYVRLPRGVRGAAIRDLITFGGITSSVLGLASFAGANVELDPRSSDFGKIKTGKDGNTRYDILGGFAPYLTLAARLATNETKTGSGEVKTMGEGFGSKTRLDASETFLENKFSPLASYVATFLRGKDPVGEPFNATKDTLQLFTPMILSDFAQVMKEEGGVNGALMSVPSIFGIGVNSYDKLGAAPLTLSMDGQEIELDTQDREKYHGVARAYYDENIGAMKADGSWDKLSEADRVELTKQVIQDARKEAKAALFDQPPEEDPEAPGGPTPIAFDAEDPDAPQLQSASYDPAAGGAPFADFPYGRLTSGHRTEAGNRAVGGVSNSMHLTGDAADFVPTKGVSWDELHDQLAVYFGPDAEIIDEGDHIHVEMPGLNAPYFGAQGTA